MARCCLSVGPGNKKGHLALRLVVCVVLFGFVNIRRESLRFFSASSEIYRVKSSADVMV
jgi:hypothetical protein